MANNLQKKLFEQGYLRVKNVLNYQRDLKPILNDMEFVMDCLIQKFAKKKDVKTILNLDFKKKYSYIFHSANKAPTKSPIAMSVVYRADRFRKCGEAYY